MVCIHFVCNNKTVYRANSDYVFAVNNETTLAVLQYPFRIRVLMHDTAHDESLGQPMMLLQGTTGSCGYFELDPNNQTDQ